MMLKINENLRGPDLPAGSRHPHAQVREVNDHYVIPVAGAGHPGIDDSPGQGLTIGGSLV